MAETKESLVHRVKSRKPGEFLDLNSADLSGANLFRVDFRGVSLFDVNLSGANLAGANFACQDIKKANLSGARLVCANLTGANLFKTNLAGANLEAAILRGASLEDTDLSGIDFTKGTDLVGASLIYADLTGSILEGYCLQGTNFGQAKFCQTWHKANYPITGEPIIIPRLDAPYRATLFPSYSSFVLQIGCETHPVEIWKQMTFEDVENLGFPEILMWEYRDFILKIVEACEALAMKPFSREF